MRIAPKPEAAHRQVAADRHYNEISTVQSLKKFPQKNPHALAMTKRIITSCRAGRPVTNWLAPNLARAMPLRPTSAYFALIFRLRTARRRRVAEALRHTAAHVLAYAVQDLFPEAKPTIGPAIENGFYYDFDRGEPFTPDDLEGSRRGCARSSRPTTR